MNSPKLKNLLKTLMLLTGLCWTGCGCVQPTHSNDPATSTTNAQQDSVTQLQPLDVASILDLNELITQKLALIPAAFHTGEKAWFSSDALHNSPQSLRETFLQAAFSDHGADSLKLAIALFNQSLIKIDASDAQIDQNNSDDTTNYQSHYADAAEKIFNALKADTTPNSVGQVLPDVIDYYLGAIALERANNHPDKAQQYALRAYDAFSRVKTYRTSSFYHRAVEGALYACIHADESCPAEDSIRTFLATYPDYPGTPALRLAYAQQLLKHDKRDLAQNALDDLAYNFPWTDAAQKASQLLEQNGWSPRERSYAETLDHVDFLRKKRFWKHAEIAIEKALNAFPDDVQLLLQDARIQYEQSYYEPAYQKFKHLYDVLNGEKKDNIRPTGVIAYMYRAQGYMGNCADALVLQDQNLNLLGVKDRQRSKLDYALTCGALDQVWTIAQKLEDSLSPYDFGFYAYLAHEYEIARTKLDEASESLSGSYKRRARYFLAQATLKAAQKKIEDQKAADAQKSADPQPNDAKNADTSTKSATSDKSAKSSKSAKNSKSSKSKNSKSAQKKKTRPALPTATVELAKKLFQQLIAEDSTDYYAILANSRLMELNGSPTLEDSPLYMPHAGAVLPLDARDKDSAKRAIHATYAFDESEKFADGNTDDWFHNQVERYADIWPQLRRIEYLSRAGLYRERNEEFRPIIIEGNAIAKLTSRPSAKNLWYTSLSIDGHLVDNRKNETGYWGIAQTETYFKLPDKKATKEREKLAEHQQKIFDDRLQIRAFLRESATLFHDYYLARRNTAQPKSLPGTAHDNETWSIFYPHAYNHAIVEASHENGLTPYLLWTLMNIESAFNPDSISIADAYGLLQIIPMTGYKLADALQIDPFGPYDLIKPENSITMGAWYFGQIVKKFHGYATLSMAGYNGGPFQVSRWLTAYGSQMEHDAFIELIPLNEARNYVKKGMARLLIFKRIDEGDSKYFYYAPNSLPQSCEFMPNF